ncbi:MAG: helix-turn-helix domain-containing protein [Mobilitalea sp.]
MKINEVIRKYRKEENLTQEQIANYLGVTAPAVNKWENGISYPDITLLAPLARILKIDVDTLLSFHEELTDAEINQIVRELSDLIQKDGYEIGFKKGEAILKDYPNCDTLRLYVADILRSFLIIKGITDTDIYDNKIIGWYEIALTSNDDKVVTLAKTSLVSYYMNKGNYQKAQQQLDEIEPVGYDKRLTQAILYEKQSRNEEAYEIYENMIYKDGHQVVSVLQLICRLLCSEKKYEEAEKYADLSKEIALSLNFGEYIAYTSSLLLAVDKTDKEQTIEMLGHMVEGIDNFDNFRNSKLYTHMKFNNLTNPDNISKKMLLDALTQNKELEFIREEPAARRLFQRLEV